MGVLSLEKLQDPKLNSMFKQIENSGEDQNLYISKKAGRNRLT